MGNASYQLGSLSGHGYHNLSRGGLSGVHSNAAIEYCMLSGGSIDIKFQHQPN